MIRSRREVVMFGLTCTAIVLGAVVMLAWIVLTAVHS